MKVLVTGASGFVGRHLIALLQSHDITVVGIGHDTVSDLPIEYHAVDLLDAATVADLDLGGVDWIFHLAGLAAAGPSFTKPRHYIDANAGMQINLFETCLRQDVHPKILVVSSGTLYATNHLPITETTPLEPSSPYAVSKIAQEQLGWYYGRRGFEVIVARPFNHIGPGQTEGFLVPDITKQLIMAERSGSHNLTVGDLSSRRDYTDVRDIVRAYLLLMQRGRPAETYNVCSGHSHAGQEILDQLRQLSGITVTVRRDPAKLRPADTADSYGDHTKLTQATGWEPQIRLEQTLADVLADWRQRPT